MRLREEKGNGQLNLPLRLRQPQGDLFREQELNGAFDHLREICEQEQGLPFPHELTALFSRPFLRDVEVCAALLRREEARERREVLVDELFYAHLRGENEKVVQLEGSLEQVVNHGR